MHNSTALLCYSSITTSQQRQTSLAHLDKDAPELSEALLSGRLKGGAVMRVELDEVHFGCDAVQQVEQPA
jgi:hypothetical protein